MAKKRQHRQVTVRSIARPGEYGIAVEKRTTSLPDGTSQISVGIDLQQVPVPDRRYAADAAGILYDGTQVKLLFAQRKVAGRDLRSLIVIGMSPDAVHRFLASCAAFIPDNTKYMVAHGIETIPLMAPPEEPDQTVAMAANIVAAARTSREATLDFYHASAAAIHALRSSDVLGLDPIVRVDLPLGILASLLEQMSVLSKELPPEITS